MNREIPCNFHAGSGFFLDTVHKALYIFRPIARNQGLLSDTIFSSKTSREDQSNRKLFLLNIGTGSWKELSSFYSYNSDLSQCPWGLWNIGKYDVTYVLNIAENKMYRSTGEFSKKASKIFDKIENDVWFFVDSTLYVGNIEQNTLDTLRISLKDFEYTGPAFHSSSKFLSWSKRTNLWVLTSAGLTLLFCVSYLLFHKRRIKSAQAAGSSGADVVMEHVPNDRKVADIEIFSTIELTLIRYIFERNRQNFTVSIEEINKILGLSEKNESVQKKNRSDAISAINRKWTISQKNTLSLLLRKRTESDKRSFEYYIRKEWISKVSLLFPNVN